MANDEYMTPLPYVNMIHEVIPRIDLDPFSSELANGRIKATRFFSIASGRNTWDVPWLGKVYANPPYSIGNLPKFSVKLKFEIDEEHITEQISLVPNSTSENWFQRLANIDKMIWCFPDHRIKFTTFENRHNL